MDTITETDQGWRINANGELFETKKLILCIGSEPKKLDLPKPTLPLPICLCKFQLEQHIHKNDRVVVFGTAHSGTLILKHLYEIGCKNTVGIYRSDKPFFFARDGVLGGIKQESAQIADKILNKEWGELTPTLISYDDFSKTYRAIEKADFVLYSIGFKPLTVKYTGITGEIKNLTHDPKTGQFENVKNIWGFGIAFPSFKPDTSFPDIGFNGFIKSIQNSAPLFQS
jgi:pyruvate/2-oxoglutarate dehydrogenase complex dihydrolipoamide dehydrogenase (E3) component